MTEERKLQLAAEVDATGAKKGFDQIKADAKDMAQAVGQAGQSAGKAIDGIGAGAPAASAKVDGATRSIIGSIQRTTAMMEAGGRTSAKYYEALAAQRGVSVDALKPYLAQLDAVAVKQAQATGALNAGASGLNAVGMSAKQTAFALRGVPAQFTDIFTSLQGGQKPMTVLFQQGGQLKDMFGGIGPAARAMGGYVMGLINPLTLTAGAVGVLGYALSEGRGELKAFQNAATISGNFIAVSASQFTALRDGIAGIAGTRGKAAEVLTEIAQNGKIAGENVKSIAEAAILMEKATGQATSKTISQFAELAKTPADAAAKLNEQYNFLTVSVYKQIKALEEQGKALQATSLAEQTYADALKGRASTVIENAGTMEKAWRGIAGAAKGAWDAMLGVGRDLSPGERMASAAADVARIQAQIAGVSAFGATGGGAATGGASAARKAALEQELTGAKQALVDAQRRVEIEQRNTHEKAEQNRLNQLGIAFDKQGDEFKTKAAKRDEEIRKAQIEGQELVNAGKLKQFELDQRLANIREKYKDSTGQGEVAGIEARNQQRELYLRNLRRQIAGEIPLTDQVKPTQNEELAAKLQKELATSITGVARAQKEKALASAQSGIQTDKDIDAAERQKKGLIDLQATLEKQADAVAKQADAIRDQAAGQEAVNANFGKSKTAIEQATLAQLKLQQAEADSSDRFAPAYVAALTAKTEAQERFVKALQETEYRQAALKLDEAHRVAGESAETLQLEMSLLARSQQERERIIGQRKVEVALAKELAEIEKLNLGSGPEADAKRAELRAKAAANAVVEANNAASKSVLDEWQRTADTINQSLTDALLRGFESGKGFAQNFRDTVANMFKTLVLRPDIQATVQGGMNAAGFGGSSGSGSGLMGMANNASSLNTLYGAGSQALFGGTAGASGASLAYANGVGMVGGDSLGALIGANGGWAGVSAGGAAAGGAALAASNTALATSIGLTAAEAGAAAGAAAAAGAGGAAAAGAAGAGAMGGMGAALSAIPVYGWIALAALAVVSMASGGEKRSGGQYSNANLLQGPSGGEIGGDGVRTALTGTIGSVNDMLRALGSTATLGNLQSGLESSKNGKGFAYAGGQLSTGEIFGQGTDGLGYMNRRGSMSQEEASAAFADELKQATLQALQAADVPGQLGDYLRQLGDIDLLTGGSLDAAMGRINKALAEKQQLESRLFDLSATELERLAKARNAERAAIDASNRALLEQVYAQEDLLTARGNLTQAFDRESSSLQSVIEGHRTYARELRTFRDGLLLGEQSPLGAAAKAGEAERQFNSAVTGAQAGDASSRSALTGASSAYLSAVMASASTKLQYDAAFAQVSSALTVTAASADSQATVGQQQLDVMVAQLNALGIINQSVLTFAQALAAYSGAQLNVEGAKAAVSAAAQARAVPSIVATPGPVSPAGPTVDPWIEWLMDGNRDRSFASGGFHRGGLRLVGENGPELEVTGPSRIYSASETRSMLQGAGGGNEALLSEMRAMRQDAARQQAALEAIAQRTYETSKYTREMKDRGVPALPNPDGSRLPVTTA